MITTNKSWVMDSIRCKVGVFDTAPRLKSAETYFASHGLFCLCKQAVSSYWSQL